MDASWTLAALVAEAGRHLATLPPPANGQVRPVPDERTIRYYAAIGLLDKPAAMRGRTALYGPRHLAQVVAIKRLQGAGRTLAEVQALWPTLDDATLARMSGVRVPSEGTPATASRPAFWKPLAPVRQVAPTVDERAPDPSVPAACRRPAPIELRIELAPGAVLSLVLADDAGFDSADLRALRAAAAPLIAELARRRPVPNTGEEP